MTLDDHIRELRAELDWNDDRDERRQIADELHCCLLLQITQNWKAAGAAKEVAQIR